MNLEDLMVSEASQTQRSQTLHGLTERWNLNSQNGGQNASCKGLRERENGEMSAKGYEVSIMQDA